MTRPEDRRDSLDLVDLVVRPRWERALQFGRTAVDRKTRGRIFSARRNFHCRLQRNAHAQIIRADSIISPVRVLARSASRPCLARTVPTDPHLGHQRKVTRRFKLKWQSEQINLPKSNEKQTQNRLLFSQRRTNVSQVMPKQEAYMTATRSICSVSAG
jgi:hypothetical protein